MGIYSVNGGVVANETWSGPAAPAHPTFPVTQGLTAHASGRTGAFDGRQIAWYERLAEALQPLWE